MQILIVLLLLSLPGPMWAQTAPPQAERRDTADRAPTASRMWIAAPVVSHAPETRWAGGATGMVLWRAEDRRPSTVAGEIVFTQRGQRMLELEAEGASAGDALLYSLEAASLHMPTEFFGIGNRVLEPAAEGEEYTRSEWSAGGTLSRRIGSGLYSGMSYTARDLQVRDPQDAGALAGGRVVGARGGFVSSLGATLAVDTRDGVIFPTHGSLVRLSVRAAGRALASDYGFAQAELEARRYRPIPGGGVIAARLFAAASTDRTPFFEMPRLGGEETLRGYTGGRFRDRHAVAAQLELRQPLWWRLAIATFVEAGQVAPSMDAFRGDAFHITGGVGFRFLVSRKDRLYLRFDIGRSAHATETYLTAGEAY